MIEVTVSRKIHLNLGNYESEEIMVAVKREYADYQNIKPLFEELDKEVKDFVEAEAAKIKAKVGEKQ